VPFVSRPWFRSIEIPNFFSRLQLVYQCLPVADLKVNHLGIRMKKVAKFTAVLLSVIVCCKFNLVHLKWRESWQIMVWEFRVHIIRSYHIHICYLTCDKKFVHEFSYCVACILSSFEACAAA
jgi:hypothetical protein